MPEFTSKARQGRPERWGAGGGSRFGYAPTARQCVFHACAAEVVLYGGAAGGGKSMAILAESYLRAREIPGSYNVVFRRTFPELEKSLILKSRQLYPKAFCRYNEMTHRWTIRPSAGGMDSFIDFAFCRNVKEAEDIYKSAEFTTLAVDEVQHHEWDTIRFLMSRSRSSIPGIKPRVIFGANPGGIGMAWIKDYFGIFKPDEKGYMPPERIFTPPPTEEDQEPLSRCFVPAKLSDNPALMENDPSYRKKLMLLPPATRRMLLEGDWDVFEGRFFPEFGAAHIIAPLKEIPRHWKFYRSVDYGFTDPFCCLWFSVAPDGHIYIIREAYARGMRDVEQAMMVREMTKETIEYSTADPSMWQKRDGVRSAAENYNTSGGIMLVPSKNDSRSLGWMAVRNLIAMHPDGTPVMRVFSTCVNLIKEMNMAVYGDQEKHPDDINIRSRHDHALDALRYWAVLYRGGDLPVDPTRDPYAHLDAVSRREWEGVQKRINSMGRGAADRATLHEVNRDVENDGFPADL